MPRPFTPKIVTANLLRDGDVVYLTEDDRWSTDLTEAEVMTNEAHAQMRLVESDKPAVVVGTYLADVTVSDAGPVPTHFREEFRATGPTNYTHGKAHGQRPGPDAKV
ncbi:Protein of unknown function [Jannaschia faecimaris]|uniref:Sulfite reductase (NADPH) hemoprotein beta-component n=1 Tax=Jannaschia faecimaris TaxID=1244108 RepID=A0A1H3RPJ7_9RHOB|nr:DUF2849 domain-containing protein [Jannaschia faecimaris]SDZ26829.1 Protein of unknown function [Jannaschia faecimaris]